MKIGLVAAMKKKRWFVAVLICAVSIWAALTWTENFVWVGRPSAEYQLLEAVDRGDLPLVKTLLEKGGVVSVRGNKLGFLTKAARAGHLEVVNLLIEKGADVNPKRYFLLPPITAAAEGGHRDVVKLLLDKGAEVACASCCLSGTCHDDDSGKIQGTLRT